MTYLQQFIDYGHLKLPSAINLDALADEILRNAVTKGFHFDEENPKDHAAKIALIHSEVSEWLEAIRRDPNAPSEHCPEITCAEEEMADVIIRTLHLARKEKMRVMFAILTKMKFNSTRDFKHGGKRF